MFDSAPPLAAVVTLVTGLPGMQSVFLGVPESLPTRVGAYVTLGNQTIIDRATGGLLQREMRIRVVLGYRVAAQEQGAEQAVAAALDALQAAVYSDRKNNGPLSQLLASVRLEMTLAENAEYEGIAGQEFRRLPLVIIGTQQATV